ncbi:MAG: ester cyclase [Acidobacteria bacterium]|nr:ester cyclase [Acidobacteriota bacterium]MBI3488808.1 ester cyclase [Acidobacteriota bacterium]
MRLSLVLAALCLAVPTPLASQAPDGPARNKAVVQRVFHEIFNQGRFAVADEIYAPDFQNHGLRQSVGLAEDQAAVRAEKQAFPDLTMTVERTIAEGDWVATLWIFRGTHTRAGYGGLPPTGARVAMKGITLWRVVDGRIHDEWTSFDSLSAYSQAVSQRKGWILGLAAVLVLGIVVVERAAWAMAKWAFRKLRRA